MSLVSTRDLHQNMEKVVAELRGLTFNLVTGAAADTAIAIPGFENEDTVVKVLNLTDLTEQDITHVSSGDRRAKGTLTIGVVVNDETVAVRGKTYTFKDMKEGIATNVGPGIIPFESDPSGAVDEDAIAARLAKVIMSSDSLLVASAAGPVVTVRARTEGTGGNAYTLTVGAHVTRSGANFTGGSATNGILISDSTAAKKLLVIWYNKQ